MSIIITEFSNPNKQGVTIHLNKVARLKTGVGQYKEFFISWDKIGKALIEGYTDEIDTSYLDKLRNTK